jgi:hypothetical protein
VPAPRKKKQPISTRDLSRWRLIADFQERLGAIGAIEAIEAEGGNASGSFADQRRRLKQQDYLSLLLFGLFNPVVESMRGLCAASHLARVQKEICSHPVSLGSFSEAQAVVEPELLQRVFDELAAEQREFRGDARLERYRGQLLAIDGTLWAALPRMSWAIWRWQHGPESALRAHVKFNLLEQKPVAVAITPAKRCERAVLREQWRTGEFYAGDRYYGEDYALFEEMKAAGCSFVLRLRQEARFEVIEEFALSEADRAASVTFDGIVRLGAKKKRPPIRLVRVQTQDGELLLVSDKPREELGAELVALIYRYRWRIELFFKWLKCILGCRHWLAESPRGVALQIYCALIAALLLLRYSGRAPGKRAMEMIRFYLMGYATLDELSARLGIEKKTN